MEKYKEVSNKTNPKKVMSIDEFCEEYGLGKNAAYNLAHREGAPIIRNGRKILFIRSKIDEWMESLIGKRI
ncbi:DNA-binding protein [Clostridium autoethanogenum]|uniref:DNA-binding protein n=1 Tax=Clostridium autoethanogenum TaxID=84023 RepID=A0A3M0S3E8_9CLOT|nr:helix-turn-helix domain-containing protein [Clostridium autoethanogenum]RMC93048.1 DNA-binding protein [Clostridium autoethanogenum]